MSKVDEFDPVLCKPLPIILIRDTEYPTEKAKERQNAALQALVDFLRADAFREEYVMNEFLLGEGSWRFDRLIRPQEYVPGGEQKPTEDGEESTLPEENSPLEEEQSPTADGTQSAALQEFSRRLSRKDFFSWEINPVGFRMPSFLFLLNSRTVLERVGGWFSALRENAWFRHGSDEGGLILLYDDDAELPEELIEMRNVSRTYLFKEYMERDPWILYPHLSYTQYQNDPCVLHSVKPMARQSDWGCGSDQSDVYAPATPNGDMIVLDGDGNCWNLRFEDELL